MKNNYVAPELEVTLLTSKDILLSSATLANEVDIDGEDLYSK